MMTTLYEQSESGIKIHQVTVEIDGYILTGPKYGNNPECFEREDIRYHENRAAGLCVFYTEKAVALRELELPTVVSLGESLLRGNYLP